MAKVETFKCELCPKQKSDVNHWFIVFFTRDFGGAAQVFPWTDEMAGRASAHHYCGQQCAIAAISEWMSRAGELVEVKQ